MKKVIRLTESELQQYVDSMVNEAIEEGTWDNMVAGTKAFFGRGNGSQKSKDMRTNNDQHYDPNNRYGTSTFDPNRLSRFGNSVKKRWNAAKTNYKGNQQYDDQTQVLQTLSQFDDNMTIKQAKMQVNKQKANTRSRMSKSINKIYN